MATLKVDIWRINRKLRGKAGDKVTIIKDYDNVVAVQDSEGEKWFVAKSRVNIEDEEESFPAEQITQPLPLEKNTNPGPNPVQTTLF